MEEILSKFTKLFDVMEEWVDVDEDKLSNEWKVLPHRYLKASRLLVDMTSKANDLKSELKEVEAKRFVAYKIAPHPETNKNVSDEMAKAMLLSDPDISALRRQYLKADECRISVEKLLHALEMKERSLKYLTTNFKDAIEAF